MRSQGKSMAIENASVVTPERVLENASVRVEGGIIAAVGEGRLDGCQQGVPSCRSRRIDAEGLYVLPGIVDLHGDAIEREIEPRTGALFPLNLAIVEMDKMLTSAGITTMYQSLSYSKENKLVRGNEVASEIIREVNRLAPALGARTRVHARYEASGPDAAPFIERLIDEGQVHLLSVTCHYFEGKPVGNFNPHAPELLLSGDTRRLVEKCHALGIPTASHDDDSEEKLDALEKLGIKYTEFPISADIARSAAGRGMRICLGAPNVVRGGSLFGNNLNAREAIKAGYGDILCSDYTPMAIFHSVFMLDRMGIRPLHEAVNMASLNPARAAGISNFTGSLEAGKSADMIIVDAAGEVPRVLATFVAGREAYSTARLTKEATHSEV